MKNLFRNLSLTSALVFATGLFAGQLAHAQQPVKAGYPAAIQECETRGEAHVCSTWRWNGSEYEGAWPNGSVGKMTLQIVPAAGNTAHVTVIRNDREGVTAWIRGVYTGTLKDGKITDGAAQWTYSTIQRAGSWDATFLYDQAAPAQTANGAM